MFADSNFGYRFDIPKRIGIDETGCRKGYKCFIMLEISFEVSIISNYGESCFNRP